jgi:membrane-bound lytic murein transglycosylase D
MNDHMKCLGSRPSQARGLMLLAAFGLTMLQLVCGAVRAEDSTGPFEHPPALERDIRFWIRVYTEVTTEGGLLHDDWNLGVVYEVIHFDPTDSPAQREHHVALAKARYAELLRRFSVGDTADLNAHERRISRCHYGHPLSTWAGGPLS